MAGIAFSQAGLGLCHAIAHSLGGEFHIPHGRLNAILLPAVMECNASVCGTQYAQLARTAQLSDGSDTMALRALKNKLLHLRKGLQLPENLIQAGLSPAEVHSKIDRIVAAALADPCCATNPVRPNEEMVRRILMQVVGHG
jgi:alcohol dehydrogenase class IV